MLQYRGGGKPLLTLRLILSALVLSLRLERVALPAIMRRPGGKAVMFFSDWVGPPR